MTFGEKIQKLRKEKGFSQEELAELSDVSRQSVSNWERDNGMPEIEKIIGMSDIFGVSLDYLLKSNSDEQLEHGNDTSLSEDSLYVSREMASGFLSYQKDKRLRIGIAVGLLIGSMACTFFDFGESDIIYNIIYTVSFIISIMLIVSADIFDKSYKRIWKKTLAFDSEVKKHLLADYADGKKMWKYMKLFGVCLILVGMFVMPTIPSSYNYLSGIGGLMTGVGAFMCIYWNGVYKAYRVLVD